MFNPVLKFSVAVPISLVGYGVQEWSNYSMHTL